MRACRAAQPMEQECKLQGARCATRILQLQPSLGLNSWISAAQQGHLRALLSPAPCQHWHRGSGVWGSRDRAPGSAIQTCFSYRATWQKRRKIIFSPHTPWGHQTFLENTSCYWNRLDVAQSNLLVSNSNFIYLQYFFYSVLKLKHKMCLGTALSCKLRHSLGNASRILTVAGNHKNTWMNTGQSLQKYILFTEQTLSNEIKLYSSLSTSKKDCIQKKSHSYRCRVHKESVLSPVRSLMRSKWSLGRSAQFSHTHTAKKKKSHVCLPTELPVLWSYPLLSSWFLIFAETLHETNIPLHILVCRGNGFKSVLFFPFLCNVWLKK